MNDRILKVRKALGYTQDDFSKKIGLSKNFVWMIEKGERIPSDRTIRDICREFNVNEEWLRDGTGDMFNDTDIDFGEICGSIAINDEKARDAIKKYYQLTPEDKQLFWNFIERFMK